MTKKFEILVAPQLGVNDDSAILSDWLVSNKQKINKDEIVCILESTKASFDVIAQAEGYLITLIKEGETVKINESIGIIVYNEKFIDETIDDFEKNINSNSQNLKITKKAKDFAEKNKIDLNHLEKLDRLIRIKDIEEIINKNKTSDRVDLKINNNKKPIIVYGAGRGGNTIYETIDLGEKFEVVAFIDDSFTGSFLNKPVYNIKEQSSLKEKGLTKIIIGIANGPKRIKIGKYLEKNGFEIINAIHPNSYISPSVKIGKGNHIKSGAIIDTNSVIGNYNIIDNGVVIAHDNLIGNGCHLAPSCSLGSSIEIKNHSILGIGSSVSTKVKIGKGCIIALNTSVMNDINDNSIVEGVPGKVIGKTKI